MTKRPETTSERIARSIHEGTFPHDPSGPRMVEDDPVKCLGVSRDAENDQAIIVSLSRRPSDNELRGLHDFIRDWPRGDDK